MVYILIQICSELYKFYEMFQDIDTTCFERIIECYQNLTVYIDFFMINDDKQIFNMYTIEMEMLLFTENEIKRHNCPNPIEACLEQALK